MQKLSEKQLQEILNNANAVVSASLITHMKRCLNAADADSDVIEAIDSLKVLPTDNISVFVPIVNNLATSFFTARTFEHLREEEMEREKQRKKQREETDMLKDVSEMLN